MSVRTRITVAFAAVFVACVGINYAVEHFTVLHEFERLEAEAASRNAARWAQAVERELIHLSAFAGDWAVWEDAYDFVTTGSPEFIEANLASEGWFRDFNVPVLRFQTLDGRTRWSRQVHPETQEPLVLPELERAMAPGGVLVTGDERHEACGLLGTDAGLMLVASRAVLHTDGTGPSVGCAVFARFAGDALVETLARQAVSQGEITTMDELRAAGELDPDVLAAIPAGYPVQVRHHATISTYLAVRDLFGEPTVVVRSDTPAVISAQGRMAMWLSVFSLSGAGLAALLVQLLLVNKLVLRPLRRLIEHARNVKSTGDLAARFAHGSRDEIGELASEFDEMVARLAESHTELVARSRVVGKAEIASSVTHNLGNVLNSAVVSLDMIAQTIAKMRTDGCGKAADLLDAHAGEPGSPVENDAKAAQVPRYLRSVGETLERDRADLHEEVARIKEQLRHMNEILDAQREVARHGEYQEFIDPAAAVERAVALLALSFDRHGITLERDFAEVPQLETDPVQLLQILVNLLTNAKEAMMASPAGERCVRLGLAAAADVMRITIADTGCGIAEENLETIFRAGYTTKEISSGIGLHFCSIAARQLGGSLTASSDGRGRGATFTLELPVRARVGRAAA